MTDTDEKQEPHVVEMTHDAQFVSKDAFDKVLRELFAVADDLTTLRAERDELAKENEGLRLTVKHCLNGQKWLRCEIEAIAEKAESTTGTRDGAYYRALIWIRERARAALNRGDTE